MMLNIYLYIYFVLRSDENEFYFDFNVFLFAAVLHVLRAISHARGVLRGILAPSTENIAERMC